QPRRLRARAKHARQAQRWRTQARALSRRSRGTQSQYAEATGCRIRKRRHLDRVPRVHGTGIEVVVIPAKAAEDSRTPRRFAFWTALHFYRQVLECDCPLPLWFDRAISTPVNQADYRHFLPYQRKWINDNARLKI